MSRRRGSMSTANVLLGLLPPTTRRVAPSLPALVALSRSTASAKKPVLGSKGRTVGMRASRMSSIMPWAVAPEAAARPAAAVRGPKNCRSQRPVSKTEVSDAAWRAFGFAFELIHASALSTAHRGWRAAGGRGG